MKARGRPFRGGLYAGVMRTPDGPRQFEYNVRSATGMQGWVLNDADDLADIVPALLAYATGS